MSTYQLLVYGIRWLALSFAVWVGAEVVPGIRYQGSDSIFVVALVLGLINLYVRPLVTLLALPLTILTLGFFLLVLNAIFLGLASWIAGLLGVEFHVDNFWAALFGAIVISLVSLLAGIFIKPERIARDLTGY